jgi:DNA-binding XRE family transcriptional regulator
MTTKINEIGPIPNNIIKIREEKLLSTTDLARKVGLAPTTIRRIEKGGICRIETKRKILAALGLSIEDKKLVFPNED